VIYLFSVMGFTVVNFHFVFILYSGIYRWWWHHFWNMSKRKKTKAVKVFQVMHFFLLISFRSAIWRYVTENC